MGDITILNCEVWGARAAAMYESAIIRRKRLREGMDIVNAMSSGLGYKDRAPRVGATRTCSAEENCDGERCDPVGFTCHHLFLCGQRLLWRAKVACDAERAPRAQLESSRE
jgi:hypothetical protein